MSIFISYSRLDQAYVNKLVQALKKQGLPVWLDDRIDYGDKWPRVIEENLRKCQVFLLVMSPHSRNSDWVNCELIKAKELQKPIFPLLLEGSRFLEVGNIQTVDVHGGGLPPASFFERVRSKLEKEVELKSAKGVNYSQLQQLLAAGKWKEADQETGKVMYRVAGRESGVGECLRVEDIDNFPCEDLRTINQLWLHYSGGKFGFSVQKEIYESLGGTRELNIEVWEKFCVRVGWSKKFWWFSDHFTYLTDSQLTFNLKKAPKAHLPSEKMFWVKMYKEVGGDVFTFGVGILFSRAKNCNL